MTNYTEIDRRFVRLTEGLVHMRHAGDPANPPLIILHASPLSSRTLEPLITALSTTRYVIAPDTLGNGDSAVPLQTQPELRDYADAMDRLVAEMGFDTVDVYGSHTGGHIAIEWAINHPERINRLVLESVALLDAATRQEFLERYAPPQSPAENGSQFYWAWHYLRDQMLFSPHYKKDREHLGPGGVFDAPTLHAFTMDLLKALDTYHQPYEAVFRQDVVARAALVPHETAVLNSQTEPDRSMMTALLSAFAQVQDLTENSSISEKATAIDAFLSKAKHATK